jgi:flagellum-specific peptidoglycan hydrolase FlgJ
MATDTTTPSSDDTLEEITVTAKPITLVDNTNPLRQFRSYSYHFFLLACESTEVVKYLSSPDATDAFERVQQGLQGSSLRKTITIPNVGRYVIVLDTRHDTDIIIDDVQWGTTFVGDENSSKSSVALNVVMTDGTINFIEPRGCNFLNILADLGDQLEVDMICMPFLLRTQFYGHTEDGAVIPLSAVQGSQPFAFVPVDIQGTVDERGTTYKMDIVGVVNGIIDNPNFNALVDSQTFYAVDGLNLESHLKAIEDSLNFLYKVQRTNVEKAFANKIDLSGAPDIKYHVTLEPGSDVLQHLNDFGTNYPDQVKVDNSQFTIKGTKEGGIPEVINKLMVSSKTWVSFAAEGTPPNASSIENSNKRYTFKITQEYQSSSASLGRGQIDVNIIISEYQYDTVVVKSTLNGQTQITQPKIKQDQVLPFDYIYTGRNLDILKMDINLSLGLALLQTLSTAKSLSNQGRDTAGGQIPVSYPVGATSFTGPANIHGRVRKGTPIFAPYQWLDTYLKEVEATQNTATADGVWRSFANYQSVNTSITIHGNPLIMGKVMNPDRTIPNYVQVNVKMPGSPNHPMTDDIWEYQISGNVNPGQYYQPFWYTGYYLIVSAVNKFSGGLFTQDLELVSLPQVSVAEGSVAATEETQDAVPNARSRLFPSSPTTAPQSNTTPTAPVSPTPPSGGLGKITQNPASPTHQDFVANYWNYALQASQTSGVDPDFMLAQAAVETGWGTNRFSQNFSAFFNARAYGKPNNYWQGDIIPGTTKEAGNKVPPFRAYDGPTNSFLDQNNLLSRLYPISASATDINTYANGLVNGTGGRKWDASNPTAYVNIVINAYNKIQTYKANLGIQNGMMYAGGPTPKAASADNNYLAMNNTSTTAGKSTSSSTSTTYATNRSVAAAALAQKTPIFPSS